MNKKIFSLGLYIDAIKQLRIIGIMSMVILCLEAILIPIGLYFSYNSEYYTNSLPEVHSFMAMHFLLISAFIIIAPLMTLYLFSFLNKRNASDFYHSIPHGRTALYLSFFAAIATWLFMIIFFSSALVMVASLFMKNYYIINLGGALLAAFNIFSGSLFVAACIAVAMSITGTVFNNIIVSGIIIFVPRIIITVILSSVASSLPLISSDRFIPLLDSKYNVVTGFISYLFNYGDYSTTLTSLTSGIYTLVVAIILIIVAMFLFNRRKSESAGYSAPNRFLQTSYRIIIALIVCLIPIYLIYQDITYGRDVRTVTIFEYIICYIIAIIAYFIYELITTRKWKNLVKSIPSLLILVLLNVVILGAMFGIQKGVLSFTPDTEDIDSVQFISESKSVYAYDSLSYFTKATEEIKLDDEQIRKLVSESLKSSVDTINESVEKYQNDFYNGSGSTRTVAINCGSKTYYRTLVFSNKELSSIASNLAENEDYKNVYTNLPEIGKNDTTVHFENSTISKDSAKLIYDALRKDVEQLDFEDWYEILYNEDNQDTIDTMVLNSSIGINSYSSYIPITKSLTGTFNTYLGEVYKNNGNVKDKLLNLLTNSENYSFSIELTPYNFDKNYDGMIFNLYKYETNDTNLDNFNDSQLEQFRELLENSFDTVPKTDSRLFKINFWYTDNETYTSNNYTVYVNLDNAPDVDLIKDLLDRLLF